MPAALTVANLLLLLAAAPARAACEVDVYDVRLSADLRARTDRVWIYVSPAPDAGGAVAPCRQLGLPIDQGAQLDDLRVRVRRGDRRGARFGRERARVVGGVDGGGLLLIDVPELGVGEVLDLRARWSLDPAAGLRWDPAAFGPTAGARLRLPARAALPPGAPRPPRGLISAGAPAPTQLIPPATPAARSLPGAAAPLVVDLRPARPGRAGGPPEGSQRWSTALTLAPGEGAFLPWPAEVGARACKAQGGAVAVDEPHGCRVLGLSGGSVEVSAELPLTVTFNHCAAGWPGSTLPVGGVELRAWSQPLALSAAGGWESAPGVGVPLRIGREAGEAGACRAWLRAVDGVSVVDSAADLEQILARASLLASVPEPGLPLELKHLDAQATPAAALGDAVVQWQRAELRVATGSEPRSFAPRPLVEVRRDGVGSPWEAALLLARRLRQLKLAAEPVLLRTEAGGDPASPFGWDAALVALPTPDGLLRYDPACAACGPQELHPRLWGAAALGEPPGAPGLALPPGAARYRLEGAGAARALVVTLEGPPAVLLREALAAVPPAGRIAAVEAAVGGLPLRAHEGLDSPGAPAILRFGVPVAPGPLALPALDGGAAWPGARTYTVAREGREEASFGWEATRRTDAAPADLAERWAAAQAD